MNPATGNSDFIKIGERKMVKAFMNPKYIWDSIKLLMGRNTAGWYTYLGTDMFEGMKDKPILENGNLWLNCGYWKDAKNYDDACSALADLLAQRAEINETDEILDVGFGFGDQDILWAKKYKPKKIIGLNVTPLHVEIAQKRVKEHQLDKQVDLRVGSATEIPFIESRFDKVTALESAFHFQTREDFFREALRVLKPGGKLVTADMLPLKETNSRHLLSRLVWRKAGTSLVNMYDSGVYHEKLEKAGFVNINQESIRNYVYPGIYNYTMQRYAGGDRDQITVNLTEEDIRTCRGVELWEKMGVSDYVIFTAEKPA